jgi:tetratricopeptide (TPR) repeat protein
MKREILEIVERARAKELEVLVPHVDDAEPSQPGKWTVKDTVAHLTWWREYGVTEIEAAMAGTRPRELAGDDDTQNATVYAEMHGLPAKDVLHRAADSWAQLAARIEACSEEQLLGPRTAQPEQQLWMAVRGNGFAHLAEHLGYFYMEAGDEKGAERTIMWARDLANTVPLETEHGNGEYNLACFYARRGQAARALPHLERSFSLNPSLREWVGKDADIDPIRSDPEVMRLLAPPP